MTTTELTRYEIDVEDIEYFRHGDQPLLARVYKPRGTGPFPLIIDLHGGAWCKKDRTSDAGTDEPLAKSGVFPSMVTQMISVGEATGALDAMLSKIADFYDDEVDTAVEALTALLEPMMMVFLGVVIGFIVIAMYLPIFKMASAIG